MFFDSYKFILILFFSFVISSGVNAQNLLPDPGFELWDGTTGWSGNSLAGLDHWNSSNGSPDHHHQDNDPGNTLTALVDCPLGNGDLQCGIPVEGKGVLGCWKGNGDTGTREWGVTKMTEQLTPGACYRVSFWIQNKKDNPNFEMVTNQWGVLFSASAGYPFDPNSVDYSTISDQWVASDEVIEGSEWKKIELNYNASQPYQYLTIGYMGNVADATSSTWSSSPSIGFYVWIDSVVVEQVIPSLTKSNDEEICAGDDVLLTASSDFPISWSWNGGSANTDSVWVNPLETTTYYVTAGADFDCSVIDSVVINVPVPDIEFVIVGASCDTIDNGFIELDVSGVEGPFTYLWSNGSTTQDIFDLGVGNYQVTITDGNGCEFYEEATVGLASESLVEYPDILCEGSEIVSLNPSIEVGLWSGPGVVDELAGLFDPVVAGVGEFEIRYESDSDCSDNFTMLVVVSALPSANFTADVENGCLPLTVEFTELNGAQDVSYAWNFGNGTTSNATGSINVDYTNAGSYDVSLKATDSFGCENVQNETSFIQVYELPTAKFSFSPGFASNVEPEIQFSNASSENVTVWNWDFGDDDFSSLENPIHEYNFPGIYDVTLHAFTINGCVDSTTQQVKYKEVIKIYIPNVFTPNYDGTNDHFELFVEGTIDEFSISIFNRWGGEVFYSDRHRKHLGRDF